MILHAQSIRGVDFLPNLVGSTPIAPFSPSLSLPLPSLSPTSSSPPLLLPLFPSSLLPSLIPLPHHHPLNPARGFGTALQSPSNGVRGGAPAAKVFSCILGWEITASGDDFPSWFPWPCMGVSNTFPKLGRVHYGMGPIGLRSGRVRTQDLGGNRRLCKVYNTTSSVISRQLWQWLYHHVNVKIVIRAVIISASCQLCCDASSSVSVQSLISSSFFFQRLISPNFDMCSMVTLFIQEVQLLLGDRATRKHAKDC